MVLNLKKLNSKEKKKILKVLEENYGFTDKLDYIFLLKEKKGKIYLLNKEFEDIDLEELKVDSLGLYLGALLDNNKIRLSIEGCQLIGPFAKKNVFEINDALHKLWIRGYNLEVNPEMNGFIIIKHNKDFIGCGKFVFEEGQIHNYIPKARRILSKD